MTHSFKIINGESIPLSEDERIELEQRDLAPPNLSFIAHQVRAQRNGLLSVSDWTMLDDAPVNKTLWATYRQALRDVPQQAGFPQNVQWPIAPDSQS
jgi:hypothetical protein